MQILTPKVIKAISRWLSGAIPPVYEPSACILTLKGSQRRHCAFRGRHTRTVVPIKSQTILYFSMGADMPSTYLSLHYHLIFSTKNREPLIAAEWRPRLHEYLGGTIAGLGGYSEGIGGVADHVHLLVGLRATHCLADVLRELKKAASVWVHETIGEKSFAWQEGYAAFTVSPTAREGVQHYIANQEQHHRMQSCREELIDLLAKAGIEYDPQYLD